MSRSKQHKTTKKDSDGKHRKETKEERRIRLQKQEEARQTCFKMVPFVLGFLMVLMIVFALYVRSVPPRQPKISQTAASPPNLKADFVHDVVREAEQNAQMKKAEEAAAAAAGGDNEEIVVGEQEETASETIEL